MAFGSRRKSEAATTPAPASTSTETPDPAIPPLLTPPGVEAKLVEGSPAAELAKLKATMSDLQALVATLATQPEGSPTGEASDAASKIIGAANETAESTLAAARAEAEAVIERAKTKSVEIISVARNLADTELRAERSRVGASNTAWTEHRAAIASSLAAVNTSLSAYRADLAAAASALTAAIAHLESIKLPEEILQPLPEVDQLVEEAALDGGLDPAAEPVADADAVAEIDEAADEVVAVDEIAVDEVTDDADVAESEVAAEAEDAETDADEAAAAPVVALFGAPNGNGAASNRVAAKHAGLFGN